jgi:hypothetical protein
VEAVKTRFDETGRPLHCDGGPCGGDTPAAASSACRARQRQAAGTGSAAA